MLVLLDPGHGGFDPGVVVEGVREKDITLDYAARIGREMEGRGLDVEYTRTLDRLLSSQEIVGMALALKPDAFISLHANVGPAQATGFEAYVVSSDHVAGIALADRIGREVSKVVLLMNRGTKVKRVLSLFQGRVRPAVHLELGFLTNKFDRALLCSSDGRRGIVCSIVKATAEYLQEREWMACILKGG